MPVFRNIEGVEAFMEVYAKDLELGDVVTVYDDLGLCRKGVITKI